MSDYRIEITDAQGNLRVSLFPKASAYADDEPALLGATFTIERGGNCGEGTFSLSQPLTDVHPLDRVRVWLPGDADTDPSYAGEVTGEPWPSGRGELKTRGLKERVAKLAWKSTDLPGHTLQARYQNYLLTVFGRTSPPPGVTMPASGVPQLPALLKAITPFELFGDTMDVAATAADGGSWGVNARLEVFIAASDPTLTHRFPLGSADTPPGELQNYVNSVRFPYKQPDGTDAWFEAGVGDEVAAHGATWEVTNLPANLQSLGADNPLDGLSATVIVQWQAQKSGSPALYFLQRVTVPRLFDASWTGTLADVLNPARPTPPAGYGTPNLTGFGVVELPVPIQVSTHDLIGVRVAAASYLGSVFLHGAHNALAESRLGVWTSTQTSELPWRDNSAWWTGFAPDTSEGSTPYVGGVLTLKAPSTLLSPLGGLRFMQLRVAGGLSPAVVGAITPALSPGGTAEPLDGKSVGVEVRWAALGSHPAVSETTSVPAFTFGWAGRLTDGAPSHNGNNGPPGDLIVTLPQALDLGTADRLEVHWGGTPGWDVTTVAVTVSALHPLDPAAVPVAMPAVGGAADGTGGTYRQYSPANAVSGTRYLRLQGAAAWLAGALRLQVATSGAAAGTLAGYALGLLRYRTQPVREWTGQYPDLARVPCWGMARFETPGGSVDLDVQKVTYTIGTSGFPVKVSAGTPLASTVGEAIAGAIKSVKQEIRRAGDALAATGVP